LKQVPPPGKGTLYLRPLLIGTGAALGLAPSPEYTFLIYCSPVGKYHEVSHGFGFTYIVLLIRKRFILQLVEFHIHDSFFFFLKKKKITGRKTKLKSGG
jgi:hypothetical protein